VLDAVKLEHLIISEVSGVDRPANLLDGFMVMKSAAARRRTLPQLAPEHARALKFLLTPGEVAKARAIEAEGAAEELRRQGFPIDEVRDEFARLQLQAGEWRPTWTK
jgi:hypothetical protein